MAKEHVELEPVQWDQLMQILGTAPLPWNVSNPLLMAIGSQLQAQRQTAGAMPNGSLDPQRSAAGETAGSAAAFTAAALKGGGITGRE
jgi:hypothetical protein